MTGTFGDDADFGGGTVTHIGNPLFGDYNLFVALYDDIGAHLFSRDTVSRSTTAAARSAGAV